MNEKLERTVLPVHMSIQLLIQEIYYSSGLIKKVDQENCPVRGGFRLYGIRLMAFRLNVHTPLAIEFEFRLMLFAN